MEPGTRRKRSKKPDKRTRFYQLLIYAKIVADITIIIGFFIIFYFLARFIFK